MAAGIYEIVNIKNNKRYIGSAVSIKKRLSSHVRGLRGNRHLNRYLQNAWNKHGEEGFKFNVLAVITEPKNLILREQEFIDKYKVYNRLNGYNLSPTAGSNLGMKTSEGTKRKLSKAQKGNQHCLGHKHSEETKKKISEANKDEKNAMFGKIFTEEHKRKISEALKGRVLSEETRRKMSEAGKGRKFSKETRRKISEANKGKKRSEFSEETRKKMSEAQKGEKHPMFGKKPSEETRRKISKALKGIKFSEEAKRNMSEARKGKKLNRIERKMEICADGKC